MNYFPHEGKQHEATWMSFAPTPKLWGAKLSDLVKKDLANLALSIADFEPVKMLVNKENLSSAKNLMGSDVEYFEAPLDDIWLRDTGANFVVNKLHNTLSAVDFNFNGWGNKQTHKDDAQVAKIMAEILNIPIITSSIVLEGGAIEIDGDGAGIFTQSAIINPNRNPNFRKEEIELELKRSLGLKNIIWLSGIKGKEITDGHIDFYARFTQNNKIVIAIDEDPQSFDHAVTKNHKDTLNKLILEGSLNAEIVEMVNPINCRVDTKKHENFASSYINYYLCNNGLVMPNFGDEQADLRAKELLESLFPKRKIIQANIDSIALGGGGIHCVTQQQPKLN